MQRREPFGFEVVSEDPAINYRLGLQPTKRSRPPEGVQKEELGTGEIHDTHRVPRPRWTVDRQFPTISNISRRRRAVVGSCTRVIMSCARARGFLWASLTTFGQWRCPGLLLDAMKDLIPTKQPTNQSTQLPKKNQLPIPQSHKPKRKLQNASKNILSV